MKYYTDINNELHGIDEGQDFLVQSDWTLLTDEELQVRLAPTVEQIVASKVAEAQSYLSSTDHKLFADYELKDGEYLENIKVKRKEAREFIRSNQ
jgi:hypothetical protein